MPYTSDTPMADIVAGLCVADNQAAAAFVARQSPQDIAELLPAADLLTDYSLRLKLTQPTCLRRWTTPAEIDPLPPELLKRLLQAACHQNREHVYSEMAELPFKHLVTLSSLASFIKQNAQHLHTG